jgi:HTH-type transcriptional regulator/antitoxin HigA
MGVIAVSPKKYGGLLAKTLPKVIETDAEMERFAEDLEALDRLPNPGPEERALQALLTQLIEAYDRHVALPDIPAHKVVAFLMEQRDLKQADLLPVFGSRSVASSVLNGKREPSKAHIRKLAEFFQLSPAVFF